MEEAGLVHELASLLRWLLWLLGVHPAITPGHSALREGLSLINGVLTGCRGPCLWLGPLPLRADPSHSPYLSVLRLSTLPPHHPSYPCIEWCLSSSKAPCSAPHSAAPRLALAALDNGSAMSAAGAAVPGSMASACSLVAHELTLVRGGGHTWMGCSLQSAPPAAPPQP